MDVKVHTDLGVFEAIPIEQIADGLALTKFVAFAPMHCGGKTAGKWN